MTKYQDVCAEGRKHPEFEVFEFFGSFWFRVGDFCNGEWGNRQAAQAAADFNKRKLNR